MRVEDTCLDEVKVVTADVYGDDRGFFLETWSASEFKACGIDAGFVQDNWSRSGRGVLRGLHYQIAHPQGKLVRCTRGAIFDVAVDIRRASPQFGEWTGVLLSEENKRALWVPPKFAHGFLALSEIADVHYKCTDVYHPLSERTIAWDDPAIGIDWNLDPETKVCLSDKDRQAGRLLSEADCFE